MVEAVTIIKISVGSRCISHEACDQCVQYVVMWSRARPWGCFRRGSSATRRPLLYLLPQRMRARHATSLPCTTNLQTTPESRVAMTARPDDRMSDDLECKGDKGYEVRAGLDLRVEVLRSEAVW